MTPKQKYLADAANVMWERLMDHYDCFIYCSMCDKDNCEHEGIKRLPAKINLADLICAADKAGLVIDYPYRVI